MQKTFTFWTLKLEDIIMWNSIPRWQSSCYGRANWLTYCYKCSSSWAVKRTNMLFSVYFETFTALFYSFVMIFVHVLNCCKLLVKVLLTVLTYALLESGLVRHPFRSLNVISSKWSGYLSGSCILQHAIGTWIWRNKKNVKVSHLIS